MPSSSAILTAFAALFSLASAQCATSGYVPCLAPGASVAAPPPLTPFGASGFWSPLQSVALSGIQGRSIDPDVEAWYDAGNLAKRQSSLCCRPAPVKCLYTDNSIPFCYNPDTTRLYFSDGSVAYTSNQTYYGSDGTFIDFATGVYQYPNGTQVQLDSTTSSSSSSSSPSSSSNSPSGSSITTADGSGSTATTQSTTTATQNGASSTHSSASSAAEKANAELILAGMAAAGALMLF